MVGMNEWNQSVWTIHVCKHKLDAVVRIYFLPLTTSFGIFIICFYLRVMGAWLSAVDRGCKIGSMFGFICLFISSFVFSFLLFFSSLFSSLLFIYVQSPQRFFFLFFFLNNLVIMIVDDYSLLFFSSFFIYVFLCHVYLSI